MTVESTSHKLPENARQSLSLASDEFEGDSKLVECKVLGEPEGELARDFAQGRFRNEDRIEIWCIGYPMQPSLVPRVTGEEPYCTDIAEGLPEKVRFFRALRTVGSDDATNLGFGTQGSEVRKLGPSGQTIS